MHVCIDVCMYGCMYACKYYVGMYYVCVYVCMYVCRYVYMHGRITACSHIKTEKKRCEQMLFINCFVYCESCVE